MPDSVDPSCVSSSLSVWPALNPHYRLSAVLILLLIILLVFVGRTSCLGVVLMDNLANLNFHCPASLNGLGSVPPLLFFWYLWYFSCLSTICCRIYFSLPFNIFAGGLEGEDEEDCFSLRLISFHFQIVMFWICSFRFLPSVPVDEWLKSPHLIVNDLLAATAAASG